MIDHKFINHRSIRKVSLDHGRNVVSKFVFYTVIASGLSASCAAQAQPVQTTSPPGTNSSNIYKRPSYCNASTLTGTEFLQMIQTIIAHGDLTDITFVEKTLGTKFSSHYGPSEDGKPNSEILFLGSQHVLDSPIDVHLDIFIQKLEHSKSGPIASIGFDTPSTFISDCFQFSPADISSYLGQHFFGKGYGPGSTTRFYSPENSSLATNSSKIQLDFSYDVESSSVNEIIIRQFY